MSETGAKSRTGSYGASLRRIGTATSGLELPTSSVWPSGGSFSSAVGASAPCDPAMFTIENGWPSACESAGRNTRTAESVGPPGGNGIKQAHRLARIRGLRMTGKRHGHRGAGGDRTGGDHTCDLVHLSLPYCCPDAIT